MHTPTPRRQHIDYLDGLRGVAALTVVFSHFAGAFYPAILFNQPDQVRLGVEPLIATTPISTLFAGNLAVRIFFVLSGFVLTYRFFLHYRRVEIAEAMLNRYLRLLIPIAASVLLAWVAIRLGLMRHRELAPISGAAGWLDTFWDVRPELGAALWNAAVEVLLQADYRYNPVLWTMYYEFVGSLLVLGVVLLAGRSPLRFLIYAALLVALLRSQYLGFVLGLIMADLVARRPPRVAPAAAWLPLLAVGIYLGSYPSYHDQIAGTIYAPLGGLPENLPQTIGGFLIFLAVLISAPLRRILGSRPCLLLGRLSFSFYLAHLIVIGSFGAGLFLALLPHVGYHAAFLLMLPPTTLVITAATWLLYRCADAPAIWLSQRFGKLAIGWGARAFAARRRGKGKR